MAAVGEILRRHRQARIVVVTVHHDVALLQKALAIGVLELMLKLTVDDELVSATHAALRDERYVSPLLRHRST
jgi:DNA-binding NarL/FixJ family response regulator